MDILAGLLESKQQKKKWEGCKVCNNYACINGIMFL